MKKFWFRHIAEVGNAIPNEYLPNVAQMLDAASTTLQKSNPRKKLVPVSKSNLATEGQVK